MKGSSLRSGRARTRGFQPSLEALEDRRLMSGNGFQMRLEQAGFDPLVISDNGPGDFNPAPGSIVYFGGYGTFPLNVIAGVSMRDAAGSPMLLLSSINMAGPEGGALRILLSQDDLEMPTLPGQSLRLKTDSGGTVSGPDGAVSFQSWVDDSNTNQTGGQSPGEIDSTPGAFSGSRSTDFAPPAGRCALVSETTINFSGAGITSFAHYTTLSALGPAIEIEEDPDPGLILPE